MNVYVVPVMVQSDWDGPLLIALKLVSRYRCSTW